MAEMWIFWSLSRSLSLSDSISFSLSFSLTPVCKSFYGILMHDWKNCTKFVVVNNVWFSYVILSAIAGENFYGECGSCERTVQGDRQSGDSHWWTWENEPETCQAEANWQS